MNPKTITVQAPVQVPLAPKEGLHFLHVLCGDSGFVFRWVSLADSPLYIRPKTGEKRRLIMSATSNMSELPAHGKVVLTFEEILASEDGKPAYTTWKPDEWFEYAE
jgi:hypothetical protein